MKTLKHCTNQRGVALMVVMWVLVLLMALATEFAFSMKGEVNTTRNFKEDVEAYHLAKAGVHLAMAEVLASAQFHASLPDIGLVTGIPPAPNTTAQEETPEEEKHAYRSVERRNIPLGRGTITYSIEDENSKIPINKTTRETLVKVLTAAGMEIGERRDTVADSILDWIDADKNHRLNGAESDFYENLTPPYSAKNAPIENLDELLLIKGVDKELLYGTDELTGLDQFFTVYNVKVINPNTASPEVLSAIFDETQVTQIMSAREEKGFYNNSKSDYFRIHSIGRIEGSPTNHTITVVIQKISGKDGPTLLTHYWNDNSFEDIFESELEIS